MAVGTVSALEPNQWQLISTQTPTSGTSVSFTGLSGYKTYMVALKGVTKSSNAWFYATMNSDTTAGDYGGTLGGIQFGQSASTAYGTGLIIFDANENVPHSILEMFTTSGHYNQNLYADPTAITSIQIYSDTPAGGTVTFSGGTIYLYGIAA
jgi:hypothetical protein